MNFLELVFQCVISMYAGIGILYTLQLAGILGSLAH